MHTYHSRGTKQKHHCNFAPSLSTRTHTKEKKEKKNRKAKGELHEHTGPHSLRFSSLHPAPKKDTQKMKKKKQEKTKNLKPKKIKIQSHLRCSF